MLVAPNRREESDMKTDKTDYGIYNVMNSKRGRTKKEKKSFQHTVVIADRHPVWMKANSMISFNICNQQAYSFFLLFIMLRCDCFIRIILLHLCLCSLLRQIE